MKLLKELCRVGRGTIVFAPSTVELFAYKNKCELVRMRIYSVKVWVIASSVRGIGRNKIREQVCDERKNVVYVPKKKFFLKFC